MMKVAFKTLGCKLNFSETSTISREFTKNGYEKVDFDKKSDIYIINTCSVTQNADKEFKYLVNKTKKNNPNAYVVAVGCYAQLKPKEISSIDGVDLVLGADKKFDILNYLELDKKISQNYHSCEISNVDKFKPSYSFGDRSRSFLKIQDGCDYQCSYCTIPLARGKSRSPSLNSVIDSIKVLIDKGAQEIVLTGVNIGDYGITKNINSRKNNFPDLLNQISKINDLKRLRISSIEPNLLNNDIIDLVSECEKILPHFHIPLQSGSDKILKLMKRRYLRNIYEKRFDYIKKRIPNACIGSDVIVGFPGEDDLEFKETYDFLKSIDISYLHVFSYSERSNTTSVLINNKVSKNLKNKRSKLLRELSNSKKLKFYKKNIKNYHNVLFEKENKNGYIYGFTENYVRVKSLWSNSKQNKILNCYLDGIDSDFNCVAEEFAESKV
ncbi:MAG: tRNA (N(6)-L-threonylcarbamoyladenosine(37)-C(2))-methylthiotransferase MtaB [Flavobacteriaceae bacterium]